MNKKKYIVRIIEEMKAGYNREGLKFNFYDMEDVLIFMGTIECNLVLHDDVKAIKFLVSMEDIANERYKIVADI